MASPPPKSSVRVRKTPIFSGVVAPLAIVLEVPGLTSKWYADIDEDGLVIRFIDNPPILTVGLAISLAAAIIANAAMIMRFLEVLRPKVSISIALLGFTFHDIINLVALAVFGGIYGPIDDGLSLSASYWMVCASTAASLLVTLSLIMDFVRTKDYGHAGSGLSQKQKALVLAVMALLLYLSLGSLMFAFLISIDFISALYFSTATILTVGFGDVIPPTVGAKIAVIIYAPLGICLVAMVVTSARSTILESFHASFQERLAKRRQRILERRAARRQGKAEAKSLKQTLHRIKSLGAPAAFSPLRSIITPDRSVQMESEESPQPASVQPDSGAQEAATSSPESEAASKGKERRHERTPTDNSLIAEIRQMQDDLRTHRQDLDDNYRVLEERSLHEDRSDVATKIGLAFGTFLSFWLVGAVIFRYTEDWSYFDAFWFCFIAMITIGYGDKAVRTQIGRGVFVIWGLMGVAVLTILLAVVQDAFGGALQGMVTKSTVRLFDRRSLKRRAAEAGSYSNDSRRQSQSSSTDEKAFNIASSSGHHRSRRRRHRHSRSHNSGRDQCDQSQEQSGHRRSGDDSEGRAFSDLEAGDGRSEAMQMRAFAPSSPAPPPRNSSRAAPIDATHIPTTANHGPPIPHASDASHAQPVHEQPHNASSPVLSMARAAMSFYSHSSAVLHQQEDVLRHSLAQFPKLRGALTHHHRQQLRRDGSFSSFDTIDGDEEDQHEQEERPNWTREMVNEALDTIAKGGEGSEESVNAIRLAFAHLRLQEALSDLLSQLDTIGDGTQPRPHPA